MTHMRTILTILISLLWQTGTSAQQASKSDKPGQAPAFKWVNPFRGADLPGLSHGTFRSPSMKLDVGYCIYRPPGYEKKANADRRYPVIYYLHGGRQGNENKSIRLVPIIHRHMLEGRVKPMIYVFVNGGPVSHYNLPDRQNAMGEDVFVKELIPHIDRTERTIANRFSRGLEGFSQGGRGSTRIMFRHPIVFYSVAPGGAGHSTEKRISQNEGRENDNLVFAPGYNTWDLARRFAPMSRPPLKILIHVGTEGFNYENNLEYMDFLESLGIDFERLVVPGVPHSAFKIYQKAGLKIMQFHSDNLRHTTSLPRDGAK